MESMTAKKRVPTEDEPLVCRLIKNSMSAVVAMESVMGNQSAKSIVYLTMREMLIQLDKEGLVSSADFKECEEKLDLLREKQS